MAWCSANDTTSFSAGVAFLVLTGQAVLLINYRGSTGYGQDMLESLPGKCGTQDVQDVMQAFRAVKDLGHVDESRVSVFGGSHGGFLTTHLIGWFLFGHDLTRLGEEPDEKSCVGQFPDTFFSAATRNPVTNIAHMVPLGVFHSLFVSNVEISYRLLSRIFPIGRFQNVASLTIHRNLPAPWNTARCLTCLRSPTLTR